MKINGNHLIQPTPSTTQINKDKNKENFQITLMKYQLRGKKGKK